jgi:hypothetical protein
MCHPLKNREVVFRVSVRVVRACEAVCGTLSAEPGPCAGNVSCYCCSCFSSRLPSRLVTRQVPRFVSHVMSRLVFRLFPDWCPGL